MSLKAKVQEAMKTAMKNKDKATLGTLKQLKAKIQLAETAQGKEYVLTTEEELKLLMKEAKQRKESAETYQSSGREDLAEIELAELAVIETYLPKQMSDEEIVAGVKELIAEVGASSPKDMGKVMGAAGKKFAGVADMKVVSAKVKEALM
ncbi:GatB/YqeY domain-containing protein [Flammeovirga sp. SJP92]|uniref:GatB/YqeY domain-containing protein n=1 Tax=Flammeovirga sp. SJP92 TaxID=1775430 RepID=UPI00078784AD|nr:GatB/YqeY domain-containing protein [Flammeovirga sp. SJP92]KXX72115.1 glutamyl-tRNA amidotransferase [Flammeovirga sp. SJP92]